MTNEPNPNSSPDPDSNPSPNPPPNSRPSLGARFIRWVKRPSTIAGGVAVLALGTGGGIWAYFYVRQALAPLIASQLSKILKREVQIGEVESLSLTGVDFGPTFIPATPTDPDNISVQAIEADFNLLQVILNRTLPVTVTLVEPRVYAEEDEQGNWINLDIQTDDKAEPLPIDLDITARIQDANIFLLANGEKIPLEIKANGTANLRDENTRVRYDFDTEVAGSEVTIEGDSLITTGQTRAIARIQKLSLAKLSPLVPNSPATINNGFVYANLNIDLPSFQEIPAIVGTLRIEEVEAAIEPIPQIATAEGLLRFQGKKISLEDVRGSLGEIVANVSGTVDADKGFDVAVDVDPFRLKSLLYLVPGEPPKIELDGEMEAELQVNGSLTEPVVTGTASSTSEAIKIDKIELAEIRAGFLADLSKFALNYFWVNPAAGGQITGRGEVKFPFLLQQPPTEGSGIELDFDFAADIPADDIAGAYGLPPEVSIGNIIGQATVRGTPEDPEALVKWQLPGARVTVPSAASPVPLDIAGAGELSLVEKNILLRNTALEIGDRGAVTADATVNLETNKWEGDVTAASISFDPFLPVSAELQLAEIKASGSLENLDPAAIAGSANVRLDLGGGIADAQATLNSGNIRVLANTSPIQLEQAVPQLPVPVTLLGSQVNLATTTEAIARIAAEPDENFTGIDATANLQLAVADGSINATTRLNSGQLDVTANAFGIQANRIVPDLPAPVSLLDSEVNLATRLNTLLSLAGAIAANPGNLENLANQDLTGIDATADLRLLVADGIVDAKTRLNSGELQLDATTSAIQVSQFIPDLPVPVTLRGSEVNFAARVNTLLSLAGAVAANPQNLFNQDLGGIDATADVRLGVADGTVDAKTRLNSGALELDATTSAIELSPIVPDLPVPVSLRGSEVNLAARVNTLLSLAGAVAANPQNLFNQDLSGIDATADVRLGVADGTVDAKTRLNSGALELDATTSAIELSPIVPALPVPVSLRGSEINLAARVNTLLSLAGAVAANPENLFNQDLSGIDATADVRLGIADGTVNAKTQLNSGALELDATTSAIPVSQFVPDLPVPVTLRGSEVNFAARVNTLLSLAGAVAANPENLFNQDLSGIDATADVRLGIADGTVDAKTRLNSGELQLDATTSAIAVSQIIPDLPVPVSLRGSEVNLAARVNTLLSLAGAIAANPENLFNQDLTDIDATADVRLGIADGTVDAKTRLNSGSLQLDATTSAIAVSQIIPDLPVPVSLRGSEVNLAARVNTLLSLAGAIAANPENLFNQDLSGIDATADVRLGIADGTVDAKTQLDSGSLQLDATTSAIEVSPFIPDLPVPVALLGSEVNLAARVNTLLSLAGAVAANPQNLFNQDLSGIDATADVRLGVADGTVDAKTRLNSGALELDATTSAIEVSQIVPALPLAVTLLSGEANFSAKANSLLSLAEASLAGSRLPEGDLAAINARASGKLAAASGTIDAIAKIARSQWQASINADDLLISEQLLGQLGIPNNLQSLLRELPLPLNARAQVAGDIAPLANFGSENLAIEAKEVAVSLGDQSLEASGLVSFSNLTTIPDIASVALDIAASSNFDTLPVRLPPDIQVTGGAGFNGRMEGRNLVSNPLEPGNFKLTGDLELRDFGINEILFEPLLAGKVNVATGEQVAISLAGKRVSEASPTGDRLAARLDPCEVSQCLFPYLPVSFDLRQIANTDKPTIATGRRRGDVLQVSLENFSLALLNIAPAKQFGIRGAVKGDVTGELAVNLFNLETAGNLQIAQPGLGYIVADAIAANFSYNNGVGQLRNASLQLGRSRYNAEGQVNLDLNALLAGKLDFSEINSSAVSGKVTIAEGYVQDILTTFKWFSIQDLARAVQSPDYGSAAQLQTEAVELLGESISEQLKLFGRINNSLQELAAARQAPGPPTQVDIRGGYTGEILLAGTVGDPKIDFEFGGRDWEWYPQPDFPDISDDGGVVIEESRAIPINTVIARGKIESGVITVEPMRLELGETLISFGGQVSQQGQSGVFLMENLSLETVRNFVEIPIDLQGNLNAKAVLGGDLTNPQARGEVSFVDATLNGETLERFLGGFSYSDARLKFATAEPSFAEVFASVPVPPTPRENDAVILDVNLGTQAIALLGALSQGQLEWIDGEGNVELSASGRLDLEAATIANLEAIGSINLENATIQAAAFPEDTLRANGRIALTQDSIRAEDLKAEFADSKILVTGVLPLLEAIAVPEPFTIALNQGKINIKGLYKGEVGGNIIVTGAAMSPVIGGEIRLQNGRAFVPKQQEQAAGGVLPVNSGLEISDPRNLPPGILGQTAPGEAKPGSPVSEATQAVVPVFDNFLVVLGDNFRIDNSPLFQFRINGDLTLNGSQYNLQPKGIIRLTSGEIDALSSQFFVIRDYNNKVEFLPELGLFPTLDLQLGTVVFEDTGIRRPAREGAELRDDLVFSPRPEQVNITVSVKGPSSELLAAMFGNDNREIINLVELTSIPSRSETQIVALLGREFLATIEELQGRSGRELLEFAVNRYVIQPFYRGVIFAVEQVVTNAGREVGLKDLRVFPLGEVEGIYEFDDRSFLGISYDYYFRQIQFRYEIRF